MDRLLDMLRTAVNVTGDATVSTIVAHHEKKVDKAVYNNLDADVATEVSEVSA